MSGADEGISSGCSPMVTMSIDGEELRVDAASTLMQALDCAGLLSDPPRVPTLCWHPALSASGSCRLCRVEVEGESELVAACTTRVREGMRVRTDGERIRAARRNVLELFLARHPVDCPICDRAGDCELQRHVFRHGPKQSGIRIPSAGLDRRVPLGSDLVLDRERCVHCEHCVRFCDEITGTSELVFTGHGVELAVRCAPGREVDNAYALNLVEICPVGAITRSDVHPRCRPFSQKSTRGICGGCGRGCNVFVDSVGDRVVRYRPRRNDAVNRTWLCDAGRLGASGADRPDRLLEASIRDERARLRSVPIEEAIEEAAGRIAELVDGKGAGVVAGLASAHLTNEDLYAFKRFLDGVGTDHRAVAVPMGEGDDLLVMPEKAPNARGAELLGFGSPSGLLDRLRGGGLDALIVMGHDLLEASLLDDLAVLDRLDTLILIDTTPTALVRYADVVIPSLHLLEKHGTLTNALGRVQRVEPARTPDGAPLAEGEILYRLAHALEFAGFALDWDPAIVSREMAGAVVEFAGRQFDSVGDLGLPPGDGALGSAG